MIPKKKLDQKVQEVNTFKVIIRKLPPLLKASDFYKTLENYIEDILSKYYVQGKIKEREKIDSRCYIVFSSEEKMNGFLQDYKKIFCDDRGQYFKPEIKKALNQNYTQTLNPQTNPNENTYESSQLYKEFLETQVKTDEEQVKLSEIERKSQQQQMNEEKQKKFEKIKTPLVLELEKEHQEELKRQQEREIMQKNVITTLESPSKTRNGEKKRIFIFVPIAKD